MAKKSVCEIDGCGKPAGTRQMCAMHYDRWRNGRDMHAPSRASRGEAKRWLEDHVSFSGGDCLRWPFYSDDKGYGLVKFEGSFIGAHRAMCILAHGMPPKGDRMVAAHECGKGHEGCVNPKHLKWKTYAENSGDRKKHGTHPAGERNSQARLARDAVVFIRKLEGAYSSREIGRAFGVSHTHVCRIWRGEGW